jgi:hypothetical protein
VTALKVLLRDKAPPLTDKAAWSTFPVQEYDVVIVDSLGASTEGISEKEGRQTQEFLATLKDLARRGPALLCLDNTTKAATQYRGRGEKADAVDILYECRNITGWTPSKAGDWWEDLPDFGEHTWQQRATRRTGQAVLRMAFIPSKFRPGIEPEPFVLEIDTRVDPWTLADVTAEIATAGAQAAQDQRRHDRQQVEHAAQHLMKALIARSAETPILKEEAETLLRGYGLTRKAARTLLESGGNRDVYPQGQWIIRPIPGHPSGKALGVYPIGEGNDGGRSNVIPFPRQYTPTAPPPVAVGAALDGDRSAPFSSSTSAAMNDTDLSPQPGYSTAGGDPPPEKQPCGDAEVGGPSAVPTHASAPLDTKAGDTAVHDAPTPAFAHLSASVLWCATCKRSVPCRIVVQRDGGEVSLCAACDTQGGSKAPPTPGHGPQREQNPERERDEPDGLDMGKRESMRSSTPMMYRTAYGECPRCDADEMTLVQCHGQLACVGCSTLADTALGKVRAPLAASSRMPPGPDADPSPANGTPRPEDTLPLSQAAREVFEI